MINRLKEATALLEDLDGYLDDWNCPIDLMVRVTNFLDGNQNDNDQEPRLSAIELQHAEIGIAEPVTELLNPVG